MAGAVKILKFDEDKAETWDEGPPITATRYFTAVVDKIDGAIPYLRVHRPDIQRFQKHPNLDAWVNPGPSYQLEPGSRVYRVVVPYTSALPDDPLQRAAEVEWSTWHSKEPLTRDIDGKPITTTAGELITGADEEYDNWGVSVSKNVAAVPQWVLEYRGACNSDDVRIKGIVFPAETLKIADLKISKDQEENDVVFSVVTIDLLHRPDTWLRWFPNAGYYCIQRTFEKRFKAPPQGQRRPPIELKPIEIRQYRRILDDAGEPIQTPEFLSPTGERITELWRSSDSGVAFNPVGNARKNDWRTLKRPLEPSDLIYIPAWTRKRLPFSVLPLV